MTDNAEVEDVEDNVDGDEEVFDFEANADEMFERNMATFAELVPTLHERVHGHNPVSQLVYLENGEPTVEFNDARVYEKGAVTEAREQHEAYKKFTKRLNINSFPPDALDVHARKSYVRLLERIEESGIAMKPTPARDRSYFTICFGVGLGQHIDQLVERTDCWVLVIIEPNLDLLYHSCFVYDWRPLLERMGDRGRIDFQVGEETRYSSGVLHALFRAHNPAGLDGTTIFRHYQTGILKEIEKDFSATVMTSIMGLGFFQDEINMISQTYKNLEKGKTRLMKAVGETPDIPVAVVANGPSLDDCLKTIKKNEERMIIVACGSAITTLLEHDIRPDFWVMTERIKAILEMAEDVHERFGLHDITFIGSTTVFPGLTDYFDNFILFFRPGLSSAPLFTTRDDQVLKVPDPLAANSGLSAFLHLGVREFYFIGVDVGSRHSDRGHASGGFYQGREDHIKVLDVPLPANFGGTVYSTPVLKWSKEGIEKLTMSSTGRVFYNLSDGALIDRATPLHRKAAKFKEPKRPKKDIVKELTQKCEVYTLDEFEERWDEIAIIDSLPEFTGKLKAALVDDDMNSFKYAYDVAQMLEPWQSSSAMAMLVRGSAYTFLIASEFWHSRVAKDEELEVFQQIFREEYSNMLDHLTERATDVFTRVEDGEPWVDEFVE